MHEVDCLDCGSEYVKVIANFGSTAIYRCSDCGYKFSDSDVEFGEELKTGKIRKRHTDYDDDDDEAY